MTRYATCAALLAAALASLPLDGSRAADAAPPIPYADADAMSPHDLAMRSFDQFAARLTEKQIFPPKKWAALTPGETHLDLAELAQPPVAFAPGLCRTSRMVFAYNLPVPLDGGSPRDIKFAPTNTVSFDTVYAIIGPTGAPGDKPDDKTISECAKLTGFSQGFFNAGSGVVAYLAATLLADAKSLAAAPSPVNFTFSCIGQTAYCADTRDILAKLDLKDVVQVTPCVTDFDDPPKGRCEVVRIHPHPKQILFDGPNDWYVKIESGANGTTVQMKPYGTITVVEPR